MTATIEVRDLSVRYGETTAIDGLDVTFEPGRIHGLLGRNGSGKTSLLSTLAAFRAPSAGEVLLDGSPVFEDPAAVRRICLIRGAGDTVEHDWPGDKVHDALQLAATLRPAWDAAFADRLVERFSLPRRARLPELSRGQRSALGVVLGLACRAPVTMLDETYLGMDAPSRYAFYDELLADHAAHPRTVLVSTHLIEEVARLFETVTIIDHGRLVLQSEADDLRAQGAAVTGPAAVVSDFTDGLEVVASKQLGPTRSDTVFGELDQPRRQQARAAGLTLEPVPLQDLFVHLTDPARTSRRPTGDRERTPR